MTKRIEYIIDEILDQYISSLDYRIQWMKRFYRTIDFSLVGIAEN